MNDAPPQKHFDSTQTTQFTQVVDKLIADEKKRAKKKCKTQGEESIEKLITEGGQIIDSIKPKLSKKENNSHLKLTNDVSKSSLTYKGDSTLGNMKMKRIAEKLSELTNKYPLDKKKSRLKGRE